MKILVCILSCIIGILYAGSFIDDNIDIKSYLDNAFILNFNHDKKPLLYLKDKLANNKDIKIRVLGDSHIAGDFITHELREIIGDINSVGFVYPLMPKYHNNFLVQYEEKNFTIFDSRKRGYDILDYALGGVVAMPEKLGASITIDVNEKSLASLNSKDFIVQIIFQSKENTRSFRIEDSNGLVEVLTPSSNRWEIAKYHLRFPITIEALYENAKLGGYFIYKQEEPSLIEHLGINGARSDIWLRWNLDSIKEQLSLLEYDLVILCYGSNDAVFDNLSKERFIDFYSEFIDILREYNPNSVILIVSPPPVMLIKEDSKTKEYTMAKSFEPVKEWIYDIAQNQRLILFDIDDFIRSTGGKDCWILNNLSKSDVHLTPSGYRLLAHAIYKSLQDVLNEF
ncbi:GDSL-type esterase/lipase family protein [Helicobacter muridarum]|uniref:Periplasmic protein n=1 Tax=Helicobacter muridarum TaxID=216 RepID=A0A099TZ64_9HELI|nr:GDSL-type esterase/lipase family protein [Helicobacter muridarum]STQ85754.1 periplasmic protein [Helicobacter muridarum]